MWDVTLKWTNSTGFGEINVGGVRIGFMSMGIFVGTFDVACLFNVECYFEIRFFRGSRIVVDGMV